MKKKIINRNRVITLLSFAFFQFILFTFTTLIFGVNHPLRGLLDTSIYLYIIGASLIVVPLYMFLGVIAIVARTHALKTKNDFKTVMYFILVVYVFLLIVGVLVNYFFNYNQLLEWYMLLNFPTAFALNIITEPLQLLNPIVILTAITPPLSFLYGGLARIKHVKKRYRNV